MAICHKNGRSTIDISAILDEIFTDFGKQFLQMISACLVGTAHPTIRNLCNLVFKSKIQAAVAKVYGYEGEFVAICFLSL